MDLNSLTIALKNFYYTNTYLSLAIGAGLLLFLWLKPKAAFKTLGVILVFVVAVYCFSLLGKSSSTGMDSKDRMINQTRKKME